MAKQKKTKKTQTSNKRGQNKTKITEVIKDSAKLNAKQKIAMEKVKRGVDGKNLRSTARTAAAAQTAQEISEDRKQAEIAKYDYLSKMEELVTGGTNPNQQGSPSSSNGDSTVDFTYGGK